MGETWMEKEYDIVAMGELLIDFTPAGVSETGMCLYERNPGGAPVNMLTAAAKAGLRTAFIGKVGNDMHGKFLIEAVENQNINSDGIILDDNVFTTLAFVNLTKMEKIICVCKETRSRYNDRVQGSRYSNFTEYKSFSCGFTLSY